MILRSSSLLICALSSFAFIWRRAEAEASSSSASSSEETGTLQLKANSNTRIAWLIDSDSLPWRGSYSFLSPPSRRGSAPFSVPLLSVIDTHSQLLLAECRATLEPNSVWRHFYWILDSSALQCNVSGQDYTVDPFVGKSKIREFNARISSSTSTICLKELRIDGEPESQDCPPRFSSASGFSYTPNLDCSCSLTSAEQEPALNDASTNRNMHESRIVRRKPEGMSPGAVANPPVAFPMFRPVALSSASRIAASPIEAPTDDDHFEFVPLPSTVKARAPVEFKDIIGGENSHQFLTVFATKKPPTTTTIKDMGAVNDPCIKFECKNNGSCDVGANFMPFCLCQNGFTGRNCEVRMCDTISCHTPLEACRIRNGRATCECVEGREGDDCRKNRTQTSTSLPAIPQALICANECKNGGKCVKANEKDNNVCQCAEGYLGANCNILDLCAVNSTCVPFGPDAKCLIDAQSLSTKVSNVLINSPHLCMCYNDNSEWVDCSELPQFELPQTGMIAPITTTSVALTSTTASPQRNLSSDISDELPSPVPSISWGPPTPPPLLASEDKSSESETQEATKPQFPLHMHIPFLKSTTSKESESGLASASKESSAAAEGEKSVATADHTPAFPITNISSNFFKHLNSFTSKTPELNIKNLTETDDTMPHGQHSFIPTFVTLPPSFINSSTNQNSEEVKALEIDSSSTVSIPQTQVFLATTVSTGHAFRPSATTPAGDGDDDEQDGDNGFERVTQIAESAVGSNVNNETMGRVTELTGLISTNNQSEIRETDHFGVRPPMGGFSPHEEHGGAFVSPSSEHNHVEMEVDEQEQQHPSQQKHNHTFLPMPPATAIDTHFLENNSIVSTVGLGKPKNNKELEFGQKVVDLEGDPENKSPFSSKKNGNEISESKAVDHNSVANAEQGNRKLPNSSNGNLISWIVAIGVVSFFLISIATGTICVGRYVRRSRRLHGKYNPAREENAVACTYSMPMTTVNKEERLI